MADSPLKDVAAELAARLAALEALVADHEVRFEELLTVGHRVKPKVQE